MTDEFPAERVIEHALRALKREESEPRELDEDQRRRVAQAVELWDAGADPRGTLAAKYLNEYRLLNLPDSLAGTVLRFHPHCPLRDENTGINDLRAGAPRRFLVPSITTRSPPFTALP